MFNILSCALTALRPGVEFQECGKQKAYTKEAIVKGFVDHYYKFHKTYEEIPEILMK